MAREIRSLTGMRGMAACAIMIMHYYPTPRPDLPLIHIMSHFYIAVDFFLVLSGFVLSMSYAGLAAHWRDWRAVRRFLVHRIARIYPLYLGTTILCFFLTRHGWLSEKYATDTPGALLANLAMVQAWGWPNDSLNVPAWSISTEWAANLLFVPLLPVMLGGAAGRAVRVAAGGFLVVSVAALLFGEMDNARLQGALDVTAAPAGLLRCVGEFNLGMLCWRLRAGWPAAAALGRPLVVNGALLVSLALLALPSVDLLFVLVICVLVIGLSFEATTAARLLASRLPHSLGVVSYSIYMLHFPLLAARAKLFVRLRLHGLPHAMMTATLITLLVALAASYASYYWFEQPAKRWVRRMLGDAVIPA